MIGRTVHLVRGPLAGLTSPPPDLVVLAKETYGDSRVMYQLLWPDGAATWHPRREFELLPVERLAQEVEG